MASEVGTLDALNGMFKIIYGDKLESFLPNTVLAQKYVGFERSKLIGKTFNFPVLVQTENGLTFSAGNSDAPVEVNAPNSLSTVEAAVLASTIIGESAISYKVAERGRSSKQAFENTVGLKLRESTAGLRRGLESALWSGQTDLGVLAANATSVNSTTFTVSLSGTAPGFWNSSVGMNVVLYSGTTAAANFNGTNSRTKSQQAIAQSAATGIYTVKSFSQGSGLTSTVTLTGHATDVATIVASGSGFVVNRYGTVEGSAGTFAFNETAGFEKILTNNGALYGIDASVYDPWKATQVAINAAISVDNITDAISQAWARGLADDLILFVHPQVFQDLANSTDILGRRQLDSSYKPKIDVGVNGIVLNGLNGKTEIVPSQYCKRDIAVGIVPEFWKRVGSTDFTMVNPGASDGSVFFHDSTKAAAAYRYMTDQGLVCVRPMTAGLILTGIL